MKPFERVKYLFGKYLDNTLSPEEGEELFNRIEQLDDTHLLEDIFHKGWSESGKVNREKLLTWKKLMLEQEKRQRKQVSRGRMLPIWKWTVAASILIIVGLVWWMYPVTPEFEVYHTGYGETQEIVLSDGTKVFLNANSKLVWYKDLFEDSNGKEFRLSDLSGEAYFQVSHIDQNGKILPEADENESQLIPFKVQTADLTINVLGTSFNVSNRRGQTDVYLDEGKVELELFSEPTEDLSSNTDNRIKKSISSTIEMNPGDVVTFSARTRDLKKIEAVNPENFTEWKDGTLIFENVEFGAMLKRLEDIYGKTFTIRDSVLLQLPVNFGLPYENWETVTQLMELSLNVKLIEERNNKVVVEKRKG